MIRLQPAPACRNIILRNEYLEESLGASFAADESAVGFGEGSGRQNQLGFLGRRIGEVIENDHVRRSFEEGVDFSSGRAAVEIVFQDDHRVGTSIPDRLKRGAQRVSTHECRAHRIAFGSRKTERGVRGHRHIRGRLNDSLAARNSYRKSPAASWQL